MVPGWVPTVPSTTVVDLAWDIGGPDASVLVPCWVITSPGTFIVDPGWIITGLGARLGYNCPKYLWGKSRGYN